MTHDDSWRTPSETWRSGAWSLERRGDELADVRWRGRIVLRSVRAVARDRDWNTPAMHVDAVAASPGALEISVHADDFGAAISGAVRVRADGDRLTIGWRGASAVDWLTNRTGLVALHPPHLAGAALDVVHADGSSERTAFPTAISPHQPVRDITRLGWRDAGMDVAVAFSGDVFEMEDQRNWTDASFKTYSRPLDLPFPYPVAAGQELRQSIEISVAGDPAPDHAVSSRIALVPSGAFPEILTCASSAPDPAPAIPPIGDTLLVELDLAAPNWRRALHRVPQRPLDVRLVLPQDDEDLSPVSVRALDAAVDALADREIRRIAAFSRQVHTARSVHVSALRCALSRVGVSAHVVVGARSHFTELNREQAALPADADGVVFASTPLFHALGTEQLVESVAMQRLTAEQAVRIARGLPVHVGPVTLRPRYNNVATAPAPMPSRDDLAEGYGAAFTGGVDDRQTASELAAWVIASAAAFAVPGVSSIAYFEEWGPRGLYTADGTATAAATAVRALTALSGAELLSGASPDGLLWAVGGRRDGREVVLAANLSDAARTAVVEVDGREIEVALEAWGWAERTV